MATKIVGSFAVDEEIDNKQDILLNAFSTYGGTIYIISDSIEEKNEIIDMLNKEIEKSIEAHNKEAKKYNKQDKEPE